MHKNLKFLHMTNFLHRYIPGICDKYQVFQRAEKKAPGNETLNGVQRFHGQWTKVGWNKIPEVVSELHTWLQTLQRNWLKQVYLSVVDLTQTESTSMVAAAAQGFLSKPSCLLGKFAIRPQQCNVGGKLQQRGICSVTSTFHSPSSPHRHRAPGLSWGCSEITFYPLCTTFLCILMAAIRSDMADPKVSFGLVWAVVVCRAKKCYFVGQT